MNEVFGSLSLSPGLWQTHRIKEVVEKAPGPAQ